MRPVRGFTPWHEVRSSWRQEDAMTQTIRTWAFPVTLTAMWMLATSYTLFIASRPW
jgi:hypothetical protein